LKRDTKNLSKMKNLEANAPEAMNAVVAFDKATLAEGTIPRKYKEADGPRRRVYDPVPVLHRDPFEQRARARHVGRGKSRSRSRRGGVARGWGDYPRHPRHEGNLNGMLD